MKIQRNFCSVLFLLAATVVPTALPAQTLSAPKPPAAKNGEADGLAMQYMMLDERLFNPAPRLVLPRVSLKEFVAQLSRESKVSLQIADLPKDASRAELCAILRDNDKTVSQVMDALASLMSYQKAVWHWEQTKGPDGLYGYTLQPSRALRGLVNREQTQARANFEAQEGVFQKALDMTPNQLQKAAQSNPYLLALANRTGIPDLEMRDKLETFFRLPPTQRMQALRGESVPVPLEALSDEHRNRLAQTFARDGRRPTLFFQSRPPFNAGLVPSLYFGTTEGGSLSGTELWGGAVVNKAIREHLSALWIVRGDLAQNPTAEARLLQSPPSATQTPETVRKLAPDDAVPRLYFALTESTPISLLALLDPYRSSGAARSDTPLTDNPFSVLPAGASPYGLPLRRLLEAQPLDYKWREGLLLFRDASAPFTPAPGFLFPDF